MRRNSAGMGVKPILWLTVLVGKADRGYDSVGSAGHKPVVFHAAVRDGNTRSAGPLGQASFQTLSAESRPGAGGRSACSPPTWEGQCC